MKNFDFTCKFELYIALKLSLTEVLVCIGFQEFSFDVCMMYIVAYYHTHQFTGWRKDTRWMLKPPCIFYRVYFSKYLVTV